MNEFSKLMIRHIGDLSLYQPKLYVREVLLNGCTFCVEFKVRRGKFELIAAEFYDEERQECDSLAYKLGEIVEEYYNKETR